MSPSKNIKLRVVSISLSRKAIKSRLGTKKGRKGERNS